MAATGAAARPLAWEWDRTPDQLAAELIRLDGHVAALVATVDPSAAGSDLSRDARCLLGIRAAALWTVAQTAAAPVTRREVSPTFWTAREEMKAAEQLIAEGAPSWPFAVGVTRWTDWLLGIESSVRYPPVT